MICGRTRRPIRAVTPCRWRLARRFERKARPTRRCKYSNGLRCSCRWTAAKAVRTRRCRRSRSGIAPEVGRSMTKRRVVVVAAALLTAFPALQPRAGAQLPSGAADDRFAGLQWRFVRIKYHYVNEGSRVVEDFLGEPWGIDS